MGIDVQGLGYLATPASGKGQGIIVLQEWWGLVPHIKSVADRFTKLGYVVLAPDLFHGAKTTSPDEAERMLMALNIEQTAQDLQAAIDFLRHHKAVEGDRIGVVGFCMGGQLALLAATVSSKIGAVVNFYGIHPNVKPDFSKLSAPVLGLFGESDTFVPPSSVRSLGEAIREAHGSIETHIYPNVGHAFFNDTRPEAYDSATSMDAWERTIGFLRQHLVTHY